MKNSSTDMELESFCHFGSFFALLLPTPKILKKKNEQSICRCHHLKLLPQKTQSYDVCLLRYGIRQTIFCHFRSFFALLPQPQKVKFGKNVKNTRRYYLFTHVYHKSRSYDVWFLRYKVQRIEFFVILGQFSPLVLLTTQKIKTLKKKNAWRYYHFTHVYGS